MPERVDRRREVEDELRRYGVTLDDPNVEIFAGQRFDDKADFPTMGARGSFVSHRRVLEAVVDRGLVSALIIEDDVRFISNVHGIAAQLVQRLPNLSWDILYIGYQQPVSAPNGDILREWDDVTLGGHCYAVQGEVIPRILDFMHSCETRPSGHVDGGPMFRDGAFNFFRQRNPDIKTYLVVPSLANQRSSRTSVHNLRWYDRLPAARPLVSAVRKLKNLW